LHKDSRLITVFCNGENLGKNLYVAHFLSVNAFVTIVPDVIHAKQYKYTASMDIFCWLNIR